MKFLYQIFIMLFLTIFVSGCENKNQEIKYEKKEKYDFRNKKNQDFYSTLMRKVEIILEKTGKGTIFNNGFRINFDSNLAKSYFNMENFPENLTFQIIVERTDEQIIKKRTASDKYFSSSDEILKRYDNLSKQGINQHIYAPCSEADQEKNLFCIQRPYFKDLKYFYFLDGELKKQYINQSLSFTCDRITNERTNGIYKVCNLSSLPSENKNIIINIHFSDDSPQVKNAPQKFFKIMPYIDKFFYQITGEHLWQTLPKKN